MTFASTSPAWSRAPSEAGGLGNKFLAHIRECDAICQVVRVFSDDDVTHVTGQVDPKSNMRSSIPN